MTDGAWDRAVRRGEINAQLARGEITSMQANELLGIVNGKVKRL